MAVKKQTETLQRGTVIWNIRRRKYPEEEIDLSNADLSRANLSGADLSRANLSEANLSNADLSDAFLCQVNLNRANLSGANLSGANLSGATTSQTIFNNLDLRSVKGLETIQHFGPSGITTSTLERSEGEIPEIFLKGAGLSDHFITYARSLVQSPIQYSTCFLSYSSTDQDFAAQLYANLQSKGVHCWYSSHLMGAGEDFFSRFDASIRLYDKLLLILSHHSIESDWVKKEVEMAFTREHTQKKRVLFPMKLDETLTRTRQAWADDIQNRGHIIDFAGWKDHDIYQKSLEKLLNDLQASETKKQP